jgi:inorganic pyrophosphatase
MRDEKGADEKILCVALADPLWGHAEDLEHVPPHRLVEIEHFFATYKLLENKAVEVLGWRPRAEALEVLLRDREVYRLERAGEVSDRTKAPGS